MEAIDLLVNGTSLRMDTDFDYMNLDSNYVSQKILDVKAEGACRFGNDHDRVLINEAVDLLFDGAPRIVGEIFYDSDILNFQGSFLGSHVFNVRHGGWRWFLEIAFTRTSEEDPLFMSDLRRENQ